MPGVVFFLDDTTCQPVDTFVELSGIDHGAMDEQVLDERSDFFFEDPHIRFQDIARLAAHWKVHVEVLECFVVEIGLAALADLAVEDIAAVRAEAVTPIGNGLREVLPEEADGHPHVDVGCVGGAARTVAGVAGQVGGIMAQDAEFEGFFGFVELREFVFPDLAEGFVEVRGVQFGFLRFGKGVPFTDAVDEGFFKDCLRADAVAEFGPGDRVGGDGAVEYVALAEEVEVDDNADRLDGADGLGDVDKGHAVAEDGGEGSVVKFNWFVVEHGEEHFPVFDARGMDTAAVKVIDQVVDFIGCNTMPINRLSNRRHFQYGTGHPEVCLRSHLSHKVTEPGSITSCQFEIIAEGDATSPRSRIKLSSMLFRKKFLEDL